MMSKRWLWLAVVVLGAVMSPPAHSRVAAQGADDCPQSVWIALARAGAACHALTREQVCYGNGTVSAALHTDGSFDQPGDIAPLNDVRALHVGLADGLTAEWGVIRLQMQADLVDVEQRSITVLAFGSATLENLAPYTPHIAVTSAATLHARAAPDPTADLLQRYGLRTTLMANGRSAEGGWLRVLLPGTNDLGWIARELVTAEAALDTLAVVDANTFFIRPFQVAALHTGAGDALCEGAPPSGVLIQTPNVTTEITLVWNDVTMRLAATVFVQAVPGEQLTVAVLDGHATFTASSESVYVPAGAQVRLALDEDSLIAMPPAVVEPYNSLVLATLPINHLPHRFALGDPLTTEALAALVAAHFAPTPTPFPPGAEPGAQQCVRSTQYSTDLRAGPGLFYEIVNEVAGGVRVYPELQLTDADGITWWQLATSNWIRMDAVASTGTCAAVPVTDYARPPADNTLSLETCATTNGPLRAGQLVTLEFVPPAFQSAVEARDALRIDPGRISVGGRYLYVRASRPIQVADERYVRVFRAEWTAEVGTFRINGKRLSYQVICDVTVPLGR